MGPDAGAYVTVPGSCFLALFFLFLNFTQCFPPVRTLPAAQNKREADYTLDDSFWNEENPVGEVERLLREFRQNQELVRNIGAHYYQIIYPVQLRHHEKMGISTREVGQPKYPNRYDSVYQSGGPAAGRVRSRQAGKHFHHTSLLIKAFNHKFRLDLELNTQLLAPNLMQKHYLQNGAEQVSKQEIEHCYYHGTVKDYPGASAAFHTCNGVSGVIHVGNETFVIHPFFGGDLSQKHPHVIFEARTKANKGCANTGNYEWRMGGREGVGAQSLQFTSSSSSQARGKREARRNRGTSTSEEEKRWRSRNLKEEERKRNKISKEKEKIRNRSSKEKMWRNKTGNPVEEGWWRSPEEMSRRRRRRSAEEEEYWRRRNGTSEETRRRRERRDVSVTTKYIETALVIDKAMFEKRNGSTRLEVVHDAIQVANIADLYFRTMNTRVSVVYIETWQGSNQAVIDKSQDINIALLNFKDYTQRHLFRFDKDTTQLLTGEIFASGEAGMAVPQSICTPKSVGLSVDVNSYELHLLAGTMAHMIGHNIGMAHDKPDCLCNDWHGCIMNPSIVGLENVQPYKFSACSLDDYNMALRTGRGLCLLNKPNELEARRTCGNNKIEEGEDCDCGPIEQCADKCCDPITCKLRKDAECASGPCCNKCRLRPSGVVCREASNECDLPEFCTGESGHCPTDVHKKNGHPCDESKSPKKKAQGYCYNGMCPSINVQCANVWGHGAKSGDEECFRAFNSKGSINGHCGTDGDQYYVKCESDNAICGSLQCQNGKATPLLYNPTANPTLDFATTIISIKGMEFECKTTSGTKKDSDLPPHGLVRDGTPCGENLICVNQSCVSIYPYMDPGHCPSNHKNHECSANGVCSNTNKCHCNMGWGGPDCSLKVDISLYTFPSTEATLSPQDHLDATRAKEDLEKQMKSKVTPYGNGDTDQLSTFILVIIMVGVVKGVFFGFALIAVCYRKSQSSLPKYDPPYVKPMAKKYSKSSNPEEEAMECADKIRSFGNMTPFNEQQRLFRSSGAMNHSVRGMPSSYEEHKMHKMQRLGLGSGSEEEPMHSGEEAESVSIIGLASNNLSKLPEKGILKKSCPYGDPYMKDKWSSEMDSQSDNLEILSQSDNNLGSDMMREGGAISEVERQLKSLNGYHEDLLQTLKRAASQHRVPSSDRGGGGASGASSICGDRGGGGGGAQSASSEDLLRRSLAAAVESHCYKRAASQDKLCDGHPQQQTHTVMVEGSSSSLHHHHHRNHRSDAEDDEDDDVPPSLGPIRIRNLEDLIRQLEHHSRHMSPSGSEDIRMSETEADRNYRLDAQSGRMRGRASLEEDTHDPPSRFTYGRYRQPSAMGGAAGGGASSTGGGASNFSHAHSVLGGGVSVGGGGASNFGHSHSPLSAHHHHHHMLRGDGGGEEEGIYESADPPSRHHRGGGDNTPDSESDDFIQAQQVLVQSASDLPLPDPPATTKVAPKAGHKMASEAGHKVAPEAGHKVAPDVGHKREYYPSPEDHSAESSPVDSDGHEDDEEEEEDDDEEEGELEAIVRQISRPSSAMEEVRRHSLPSSSQDTLESSSASPVTEQSALIRPKRYPEYKH